MILTVLKYVCTAFALIYGVFAAYEDTKDKSIHGFPILIANVIFFLPCVIDQDMNDGVSFGLLATLLVMMLFDHFGLWGSGDTKMCFGGLILSMWWLRPQTVWAIVFIIVFYMLISSLIGLITAIIKHDKLPYMGHSFLITNVITVITALFIQYGGLN